MNNEVCAQCHGTGRALAKILTRGLFELCGACGGSGRARDPDALDCVWCGRDALPDLIGAYPRDEDGDVCCLECLALAPVCDA